jgi:hypothetical protein
MIWLVRLTGEMNPKKLVKVQRKADRIANPVQYIKFHKEFSIPKV